LALELDERGAYRELLDWNYQEGSIPADQAVMARFLSIPVQEFERIWKRVSVKFQPDPNEPGRLTNPRAAEVLEEEAEYRRKAAESGRRGAKTRWGSDRVPNRVPHANPNRVSMASSPLPSSKKNTARSLANGAVSGSASPKKPARNGYPEWFTELWSLYPTDCRGSKKKAFAEARKLLTCDGDRQQALELLRKRLKHRAALQSAGVWLPRLKDLERYVKSGLALQDPEEDLPAMPNGSAGADFAKPLTRAEIEETNRLMRERGTQ
jgi:hypothetical protein